MLSILGELKQRAIFAIESRAFNLLLHCVHKLRIFALRVGVRIDTRFVFLKIVVRTIKMQIGCTAAVKIVEERVDIVAVVVALALCIPVELAEMAARTFGRHIVDVDVAAGAVGGCGRAAVRRVRRRIFHGGG